MNWYMKKVKPFWVHSRLSMSVSCLHHPWHHIITCHYPRPSNFTRVTLTPRNAFLSPLPSCALGRLSVRAPTQTDLATRRRSKAELGAEVLWVDSDDGQPWGGVPRTYLLGSRTSDGNSNKNWHWGSSFFHGWKLRVGFNLVKDIIQ